MRTQTACAHAKLAKETKRHGDPATQSTRKLPRESIYWNKFIHIFEVHSQILKDNYFIFWFLRYLFFILFYLIIYKEIIHKSYIEVYFFQIVSLTR